MQCREIRLHPQRLVAGAVELHQLDAGQGAERGHDVGQGCPLHLGRGNGRGYLRRVVGHFVDGIAHDLGKRLDAGRKLAPRAVNRAVDRQQVLLRVGALAETNVNLDRAVAHDRAYADQIGQGEDLTLKRPGDPRLQLGGGGARLVHDHADLGKVEARQHLDGDSQQAHKRRRQKARQRSAPKTVAGAANAGCLVPRA